MLRVAEEDARGLAVRILSIEGAPLSHARIQADLLIEAELRGVASHGLLRLPRLVQRIRNGVADPTTTGRRRWVRRGRLEVDGGRGLGPVVARAALDEASPRAREDGVAAICIRDNNHLGMLAWYADYAARLGFVLIAVTTSEALVHPWGGRRAMLGTNPIAIGVPADPEPLVLDMATSLISMGKVHDYAAQGRPLAPEWALDADGNPTTDARAAMDGALAPFGGAKGYALGLAIEVLVASLTGSALGRAVRGTLDATEPCNKGDVFILMAPSDAAGVRACVSDYLDEIRATPSSAPGQPVTVPGDGARSRRQQSEQAGLRLPPDLWNQLRALGEQTRERESMETSR